MFARVYFGYRDGVPLPNCHANAPVFGKIISERVRGLQVLNLWPYDFPMNAKSEESRPTASLWKPQVSVFLELEFGISGLERKANGQWVAQRWLIEPSTYAELHAKNNPTITRATPR